MSACACSSHFTSRAGTQSHMRSSAAPFLPGCRAVWAAAPRLAALQQVLPPASTTVLQASLDLLDAALLLADAGVFPPDQGALQVCAAVDVFCRCAWGLTAGHLSHNLAPFFAVHACKPKFDLAPPLQAWARSCSC